METKEQIELYLKDHPDQIHTALQNGDIKPSDILNIKKMETKISRINIMSHLIEYELQLVGHTLLDVESDDKWFFNFTMTREQLGQFKEYTIPLLQKVFKYNKRKAFATFEWYWENFGLRLKG